MSEFDNDNVQDNEMDRLLQGAFDSRPRGGGSGPSLVDIRHRARRHQRRRVGGVVGATAMLGVSGVAVLASRGSSETGIAGDEPTTTIMLGASACSIEVVSLDAFPTTTIEAFGDVSTTVVGSTFPSEATTTTLPVSAGCTPSGQFRCVNNNGTDDQGYTYFDWCEPTNYTSTTYPSNTMAGYTTYPVLETPSTFLPATTTTGSEFAPTTTT